MPHEVTTTHIASMDPNKPRPCGQSNSMPLLPSYTEDEAEQDYTMEQLWDQMLQNIQRSTGYQLLSASGASMPLLPHRAVDDPPLSFSPTTERVEGSISSPRSEDTVRPSNVLDSGGVVLMESSAATTPEPGVVGDRSLVHTSAPQLSPYASVFQTKVPIGNYTLPKRTDMPQEDLMTYRTTYSYLQGSAKEYSNTQDPLISPKAPAFDNPNMGSPVKNKNTSGIEAMYRLNAAGAARDITQRMPGARETIHHRVSSRFSFVPVSPSPLGPGHFTDDLGSDISGLVSPVPTTAPFIQAQNLKCNSAPTLSTATLQAPAAIPFSWAQSTPGSYSPFDMSHVNDPFVDRRPPEAPASGYTPHRRRAPTPETPQYHQSSQNELYHPVTGLSSPDVKSIPPPSFSITGSLRLSSLESRARLDAQKPLRQNWIEIKARELAAIARTAALLKYQHRLTHSPEDYEAWIRAQALFQEAWNIDRLMEERRNLTLPEGVRALKTGLGNLPEDGMGGKQGGIMGFKMALMERICAETVVKNDACKLSAEHLNDYSKKAVRRAVMNDVEEGIKKRQQRQVRRVADGGLANIRPAAHRP